MIYRLCMLLGLLLATSVAQAQEPETVSLSAPLVTDISQNTIEIHSSFNGAQLLIFGARSQPGDIVLAVRGPTADLVLRRKERIAGMWMHVEQEKYHALPMFYAIASSKPMAEIASPTTLHALGLGEKALLRDSNSRSTKGFDAALIDTLSDWRIWQSPFARITFFGESLFKAKLSMPDRLPSGDFTIEAYLFDQGQLVSVQVIPLKTYKTGFDAAVYNTAQNEAYAYGIGAILMALFGGWLANRLFNRRA